MAESSSQPPGGIAALVLQTMKDAVAVIDAAGTIRYVNPASERLLGSPAAELLGRNGFELVHPADLFHVRSMFATELDGNLDIPPVGFRIRRSDGLYRAVEVSGAMLDLDGGPAISICLREVDQRVDADEIRYRHNLLLTLLREAGVGIRACDAEGGVLTFDDVSRNGAPIALESGGRLPVRPERIHYRPDSLAPLAPPEEPMARALAGERVRNLEYVVVDGGLVHHRKANALPLLDPSGRRIGALVAELDITEQRQAETALRREALYDHLTGLPNRSLLQDRLAGALARQLREGDELVLLFLDLDNFKVVNDGLGHSTGDRLLVQVAERLLAALRPEDIVARLGGDEFVAVCEHVSGIEQIIAIAERMRSAVDTAVVVDGTEVHVTASIGVVVSQHEGDTPERLLRDADTAMYLAKERGRDRWELFDDTLRQGILRRIETEQALRKAIERNRLVLHFQPLVDARTRNITGVEALVRYRAPGGAIVPPDSFMAVAEQSGLIHQIDRWVLGQVCAFARQLRPAANGKPLRVTCNLSGRTLAREDGGEMIEACMDRASIGFDRISIELAERAFMTASEATIGNLTRLRERGLSLGIDDFGTGYSSLTFLRQLPVSFVKIDRTFVAGLGTNPADAAIIEAVIRLAHALGLQVAAEGVENRRQEAVLRKLGCDGMQGFLFARPMTGAALARFLDSGWPAAA